MGKWKQLDDRLNRYLRLAAFPIAVKLLKENEDLQKINQLKRPNKKIALCQIFTLRCFSTNWTR